MITLTAENVVLYLINKGIYPEHDDPTVKITSLSGKNFNLRLQFANGQDWLVKQEAIIDDACNDDFLGEWAFQSLLRCHPELSPLRAIVPEVEFYDTENAILVCRFLTSYRDLGDYYARATHPDSAVAQAIAHALGQLHCRTFNQTSYRDWMHQVDDSIHQGDRPSTSWGRLGKITPETFGRIRSDAFGFFRWVQHHPEVTAAIADLANHWQACCVVHQDLKFGNWLWCDASSEIRLIDWEKVDWGDPLTDLADVLAAYINRWLGSCTWEISSHLQSCLQTATIPLAALQPSLQTLMQTYYAAFPAIATVHPDWIIHTVRLIGRELIDRVQRDIQYYVPLGHQQAATLQLAQQLVCQPELASRSIFGMDLAAEFALPAVVA
ncbi:aminoglycoside phosphotransferase family protein [filamentous cyanobacterium LEGE 11480]|uniref:Aminoglycoside phosphotransferase family protein n=1 Tax=Romeriopsis navalis LEGE 11480 TaxID=2777977 RepID=A0A928Z328_9CYAN|nr:aminoglycoside phosphotransferase family protein [Romeriopsis navalis]MBE9031051.1 aminoglycoside phosphotransferase family protein [Romeriopsis navalis LEGE 11480]